LLPGKIVSNRPFLQFRKINEGEIVLEKEVADFIIMFTYKLVEFLVIFCFKVTDRPGHRVIDRTHYGSKRRRRPEIYDTIRENAAVSVSFKKINDNPQYVPLKICINPA
jgi:hypothetical protein